MEPAKKMDISELRQAKGNLPFTSENVETAKTIKEVIEESKESVASEVKQDIPENTVVAEKLPIEKAYIAHGALTPEQTTTVGALLKKFKRSPYDKFETTAQYSKDINDMSLTALHQHAIDVQVIPTSDKDKLIKNLENAFGVYINKTAPKIFPPSNLTVKGAANIEAIIARKLPKKY